MEYIIRLQEANPQDRNEDGNRASAGTGLYPRPNLDGGWRRAEVTNWILTPPARLAAEVPDTLPSPPGSPCPAAPAR